MGQETDARKKFRKKEKMMERMKTREKEQKRSGEAMVGTQKEGGKSEGTHRTDRPWAGGQEGRRFGIVKTWLLFPQTPTFPSPFPLLPVRSFLVGPTAYGLYSFYLRIFAGGKCKYRVMSIQRELRHIERGTTRKKKRRKRGSLDTRCCAGLIVV